MRMTALDGRAHVQIGDHLVDVAEGSNGALPSDPMAVLARWGEVRAWAGPAGDGVTPVALDESRVTCPVPAPRQVFAIGLNYRLHAIESGLAIPEVPMVFTKFQSSIADPYADLVVATEKVDWEIELAVIIGSITRGVSRDNAWSHVAGLAVAQDYSARDVQMTPKGAPQFSLGKSFPGFLPLGPWVVTPDELPNPDSLRLWCDIDGERMQDSNTDDLIFPVPVLIEYLSSVTTLFPGDVIVTGTPAGVGIGRDPQVFLRAGQVVESSIEGLGTMRQRTVPGSWSWTP
ncbi:MAG: fumarylacetoacetate hydrolase family protein [Actinobacteria bacterium]|nr:fumarylacetoacetate hydrolase family protein [Actinomycetota bacterium]